MEKTFWEKRGDRAMNWKLKDVLHPAIADAHLPGDSKADVLGAMTDKLFAAGYICDREQFLADIYRREHDAPTGMGSGVSIPHGQSSAVTKTGIAVARTAAPIPWESCVSADGWQETRLVFLFCLEDGVDFAETHLTLLAQLADRLGREESVERLLDCESGEALLSALLEEE